MPRRPRQQSGARWALQDAKNRLSEVVDAAVGGQPQVVTRRGIETAVIISHDEYTRMIGGPARRQALACYLLNVPRAGGADDEVIDRIALRPRRLT